MGAHSIVILAGRVVWWAGWLTLLLFCVGPRTARGATRAPTTQELRDDRRQFQAAELVPAKASTFIFNPGQAPRIVWRDVDEVRRLGGDGRLSVRWFDAELNEAANPKRPGRWGE